jgi:hypothetical protein
VCVVEPAELLAGSALEFDAESTDEMMRQGESDAWRALSRAGWIESAGETMETAATGV